MAKGFIKHTCGHEIEHAFFGPRAERERKAAWLEAQPCWECEKAAMLTKAIASNQAAGLPALTGSEKQIAWAEQIRAAAAPELGRCVANLRAAKIDPAASPLTAKMVEASIAIQEAMRMEASAKVWIERGQDVASLKKALLAEAYAAAGTTMEAVNAEMRAAKRN